MNVGKDLVAASATPLILGILSKGESYGYAIIKRVAELSGGELQWTDGYLPFGSVTDPTGTLVQPFAFVGALGVEDDGQGLYLMGSRHYDARTGRFLQKDPIGLAGGVNPYVYARDNPVEFIDADGREAEAADDDWQAIRSEYFAGEYAREVDQLGPDEGGFGLAQAHTRTEADATMNVLHQASAVEEVAVPYLEALAQAAGVNPEDALKAVEQETRGGRGQVSAISRTAFILDQLIRLKEYKEQLDARAKCTTPIDVSRGFAGFE